jgi:hypothetical protein
MFADDHGTGYYVDSDVWITRGVVALAIVLAVIAFVVFWRRRS